MAFVFLSNYFLSASLAFQLKLLEKKDVKVYVSEKEWHKILAGIIPKETEFLSLMGKGNTFLTDDGGMGSFADALRAKGETVMGGSKISDRLEDDRQFGQQMMAKIGIATVPSRNFKGHNAFDQAIDFIIKNPKIWVLKQNKSEDKTLNTAGKFEYGQDVIDKLSDFKTSWTEDTVDFDLQEFIFGHEVAVEGWFNGKDWIRDTRGEEVFIVNWEHKKRSNGDLGSVTGEMGTLAYRAHKDAPLTKELKKATKLLQEIKYSGNVDINFIYEPKTKKFYGLEWTTRFGYPALHYFQEMLKTPFSGLIEACAKGGNGIEVDPRWCVVVVVTVPPFPFETASRSSNAKGQRVYFTEGGKWPGKDAWTMEKSRHIHPYEVMFDKEHKYFRATGDEGYLLVVSAQDDTPEKTNMKALRFIQNNIYTPRMDYRTDIGANKRVKDCVELMMEEKLI